MSKWNGKRFSVYTSDEKSALGLIEELGEQTNYNTDELEQLKISDNKKVSHQEMQDIYKIDKDANFTGSWHGIKKPTQSNEGLAGAVQQIIDEELPKIAKIITPALFRTSLDVDDTVSLQKAIDYSIKNGCILVNDKDKYVISSPLKIEGHFNFSMKRGVITTNTQLECLLKIYTNIRPDGTHKLLQDYGYLDGIFLDCNNLCEKAIYVVEGRKLNFSNINIYNLSGKGICLDSGYEMIFRNIDIVGTSPKAIGIYTTTSDCYFTDIVMTDCKKAIYNKGFNHYTRVHAWIFTKEYLVNDAVIPKNNSIFAELHGDLAPNFTDCYSDTYYITFFINKYMRLMVNGLRTFFSPQIWTTELDNYTPYLCYFEKNDSTEDKFTLSDLSKQVIFNNCYIRGVRSYSPVKNMLLSNLPKGTCFIRIDNDSNEFGQITGLEDNNTSGLNIKSAFSYTSENCFNYVSRKNQRVNCKIKALLNDGNFSPNTEYAIAIFGDKFKPKFEFNTIAFVATDAWGSNFIPCYCYVSPTNGIKIKTPNDITTQKYVNLNIEYDIDYWN